jgi:hypothetical protein
VVFPIPLSLKGAMKRSCDSLDKQRKLWPIALAYFVRFQLKSWTDYGSRRSSKDLS